MSTLTEGVSGVSGTPVFVPPVKLYANGEVAISPSIKFKTLKTLIQPSAYKFKRIIFRPGEYNFTEPLTFPSAIVECDGAIFNTTLTDFNIGHSVSDFTHIRGGTWITNWIDTKGQAEVAYFGSCFNIGKYYGTGINANNWRIENVKLINNKKNSVGIFVFGGSGWSIDGVTTEDSSTLTRVINVHWGCDTRKPEEGTNHSSGLINNVRCKKILFRHIEAAAVVLSSVQNIIVSNVSAEESAAGIIISGGDFGYAYAKDIKGGSIIIDNLEAQRCWWSGIDVVGTNKLNIEPKLNIITSNIKANCFHSKGMSIRSANSGKVNLMMNNNSFTNFPEKSVEPANTVYTNS